jgi:hypothetical protein
MKKLALLLTVFAGFMIGCQPEAPKPAPKKEPEKKPAAAAPAEKPAETPAAPAPKEDKDKK